MFSFDVKTRHGQSPILMQALNKRNLAKKHITGSCLRQQTGITLVALIITIVVLLILASITIATILRDNGVVKNATEAQILSALSNVDEALEIYKIKNEAIKIGQGDYLGELEYEELIEEGIIREVEDNTTKRTLGIIEDFKKLELNEKLGKGYKNIKLDENGNIETVEDLYNVYLIDLEDNTLYYIKNKDVWSLTGVNNLASVPEKVKFITTWNVPEDNFTIELPCAGSYRNKFRYNNRMGRWKQRKNNNSLSNTCL